MKSAHADAWNRDRTIVRFPDPAVEVVDPRFADLIIRECAELSAGYTGNVKLLILNHFGMER